MIKRKDKYIYDSVLLPRALNRFPLSLVLKVFFWAIFRKPIGFTYYLNEDQKKIFDLIVKINKEVVCLLTDEEAYQIFQIVKSVNKINGDIAEVGVFQGGSAKLICEARSENKNVHLFDTFEGLPETTKFDGKLQIGEYSAVFEDAKKYLKDYSNLHLHKGTFPDTARPIIGRSFSFVHLDVDTYVSTLECIKFFYPLMSKGGVILSHDYTINRSLSGPVKKAFTEFFFDKTETVMEFPTSQCMVVKL